MNINFTINSDDSIEYVFGKIRELYLTHRYLRVSVKTGKMRSNDQNALSHAWYQELAQKLPEYDAAGWKRFCKLHFAVAILRSEDDDFRNFYDLTIKRNLSYEEKLIAMDFFPVTSLMDKSQLGKYLDAMQAHFLTREIFLESLEIH